MPGAVQETLPAVVSPACSPCPPGKSAPAVMFNGRENSCGQDPGAALRLPRTGWSWGETGVLPHLISHQQCLVGGQAAASVAGWASLVVTQLALRGSLCPPPLLGPAWPRGELLLQVVLVPITHSGWRCVGRLAWLQQSRASRHARCPLVNCAEWTHHPHKTWRTGPGLLSADVSAASESGHHLWWAAELASGPLPGRRGLGTRS